MNNSVYVYDREYSGYLGDVFTYTAIGVLISLLCGLLVEQNVIRLYLLLGYQGFNALSIGSLILELGIAVAFSFFLRKMSKTVAWICFVLYSISTGLTLGFLFLNYSSASVTLALGMTAIVFVSLAYIARNTEMNVLSWGSFLSAGLIAIVVGSLLNILVFHSSLADMILCYAGVIVFVGLIVFDVKKIEYYFQMGHYTADDEGKMKVFCAFELYLDFINLFIRILQIFGKRRD